MSDQIAKLRELIEAYRLKSKSAFFKPIVAAYADAADELEAKLIRESRTCGTDNAKSADEEGDSPLHRNECGPSRWQTHQSRACVRKLPVQGLCPLWVESGLKQLISAGMEYLGRHVSLDANRVSLIANPWHGFVAI